MILLIILTSIAVITLLIGFFEIPIPFIYQDPILKKKKTTFSETGLGKESKIGKIPVKNIKDFLRTAKNEVSYHIIPHSKTSDIA